MSNFQSIYNQLCLEGCKQQGKDSEGYHLWYELYVCGKKENRKEGSHKIKGAGSDTGSKREKVRTVEPHTQSQIQKKSPAMCNIQTACKAQYSVPSICPSLGTSF